MITIQANFKDTMVANLRERDPGVYVANLTQEELESMKQKCLTENLLMGNGNAAISAIAKQTAMQMAYSGASTVNVDSSIFADQQEVVLVPVNGEDITQVFQVAACKVSNIITGNISTETVVFKVYNELQVSGDAAKELKDTIISPTQPDFFKKEQSITDTNSIIKKSDMRNTEISGTLIPESAVFVTEINKFNQQCVNFRTSLLCEFYKSINSSDDNVMLAILRVSNRSYIEDIFDDVYMLHFGKVDEGDIVSIIQKNELKEIFLANLKGIGSPSISDASLRIGFNMRRLSYAPTAKWTTARRVKSNKAGFYYSSSNLTTGIIKVPTTPDIIYRHAAEINNIFAYGAALLEREIRAENGLDYSKVILPEMPTFNACNEKVLDALHVSEARYNSLKDALTSRVRDLAEATCEHKDKRNDQEALNGILG